MVLVRQLDRRVGECTAALGLILLEVTGMTQPRQELAFRIARVGGGDRIPGCVEFPREFAETRGDQRVRGRPQGCAPAGAGWRPADRRPVLRLTRSCSVRPLICY